MRLLQEEKDPRALVHGDDYATVGSFEGVRWLQKELESAFEMKTVIAGHSGKPGVVTEAKILNRVIRAVPTLINAMLRSYSRRWTSRSASR